MFHEMYSDTPITLTVMPFSTRAKKQINARVKTSLLATCISRILIAEIVLTYGAYGVTRILSSPITKYWVIP